MDTCEQHPNREISPRTIKNFKESRSHKVLLPGDVVAEINVWCRSFHLLPTRYREYDIPWWELEHIVNVRVNVTRWYWLKFGIAFIRPTH